MTTRTRQPWTIALRFTADVIEPDEPCEAGDTVDCTCTFVYGDPTLHGHGATLVSGWHDPDWSMDNVQDEPTEPESFDYTDPDPDEDHVELLAERILRVCGVPDDINASASGVTVYSADPDRDHRTGTEAMVAAHVEGLGPAEVDRLTDLLNDWRNR